ncbi:MAG TPA: hypothetical protein GX503_03875 [Clostridiales bacterium]|nr:hypothetical protein [Clostridiales bacterium]
MIINIDNSRFFPVLIEMEEAAVFLGGCLQKGLSSAACCGPLGWRNHWERARSFRMHAVHLSLCSLKEALRGIVIF